MDINSDLDTGIQSASLSSDIKAGVERVCHKAEKAGKIAALVECYRVITSETREKAIDYIADRIREESK